MGSRAETVVIGLNWVGDNILALPTYRALQHRYRAEGGIALAAPENVASLLASSGLFKQVIAWNGDTRDRIRTLRDGHFRRAVILPNSFRAAVVAFAARIEERWGYSTDCRRMLLTHRVTRGERRHQLDDYMPLLTAMSAPHVVDEIPAVSLPVAVRENARRRLRALGLTMDRPLFGIHAGGLYGKAKHWGDDRYCEVAMRLRADGFEVVLLTSPGERAQADAIAEASDGLPVVGDDGDVLQLAAAISIFGPTDPDRTVIPGVTRVVRKEIGCGPCYQKECPLGHHRCMTSISVDEVYAAAVGLFSEIDGRVEIDDVQRGVL